MLNKVKQFITMNNIKIDKPVVCAVSGGADSVLLIHVLHKLGYNVILAHVNHHKRKESEIEAIEMEKFAKSLNVPFELLNYHYSGNGNFHDESHFARYDFFKDVANKYNTNIIATAHHAKDQAETILIKLMEGSNLYGYGGMPTSYNDGKYLVIRPILSLTKDEIYEYVKNNNLKWFEDNSNYEDDFLRNRLRHHVIPLLEHECPDLYQKVIKYSNILHESFDYIRSNSKEYLLNNNDMIDISNFKDLNIALKKDIISLMLEKYDIKKNTAIINDILNMTNDLCGSKEMSLKNGYFLFKEYNLVFISKKEIEKYPEITLNIDETKIFMNKYKFYFSKNLPNNNEKYIKLCYNQLELPFIIRTRNNGDFIELMEGTKKVSRVLIDKKVPKIKRDLVPLVLDNKNNLLWIYNYLKSNSVYKMKDDFDIYLICEVL